MKKERLSDTISREIEKMIIKSFSPGDRIPSELELVDTFSVGRSTIREALEILSARGMLERKNEGTFVSTEINECLIEPLSLLINMEIGNLENLMELRELVELGIIRIAANRIDDEKIFKLQKLDWQMKEPGLVAEKVQSLDIEFHNTIVEATGNQLLVELLNALRKVVALHMEKPQKLMPVIDKMMDYHGQLIKALKDHDEDNAYDILSDYFKMGRKER